MDAQSIPAVLVVDDDDHIRSLVCDVLDLEGYETRPARDGRAALDLLANWQPDLIMLDLNMPVMDGWTFCAHQQERPDIAGIPVALMSATHNLRERPLPCVPVAIIEKPFDLDDLVRNVAEALTSQPQDS